MFGMFPKGWSTLRRLAFLYSSTLCERIVELSGAVISFIGRSSTEILSLTAAITPVQDLHGYDHPWPGGGGKNVMPLTVATVKASSTAGTWSNNAYTINGVTFTLNTDSGGNLESITTSGTASETAPLVLARNVSFASGSYVLNGAPSGGSSSKWELVLFGAASDFGSGVDFTSTGQTITAIAIYIYNGQNSSGLTFKPMLRLSSVSDTTFAPYSNICPITGFTGANIYVSPTQNQADATVYNVNWTSEAGTVYGGTLDVVSGVLTVDKAMVDLGTLNYTYDSSGRFYTSINGKKNEASDQDMMLAISSMYMPMTATAFQNTPTDGTMRGATTGGYVYFRNSAYTDAATFKTAMSGVQIVYELATPIEYTLTPQEVTALVGQNYLWSDVGDVTAKIKNAR